MTAQVELQVAEAVAEEAAALPQRPLADAMRVVAGGRPASSRPSARARRASAPRRRRRSPRDGLRPGTLLGALPGLSASALANHSASLEGVPLECGLRLILKSYELDALAASPEEARAWVRGINYLPLGGKHRRLLLQMRQHVRAKDAIESNTVSLDEMLSGGDGDDGA